MSVSPGDGDIIELRDYGVILWRHRVLVLMVGLVITLAGGVVTALQPPVFESESVIQLRKIEINRSSPVPIFDASSLVDAINTLSFVEPAAQAAGIHAPARSLVRGVHVGRMNDARMVRLRVRLTDPTLARALNEVLAQEFIEQVAAEVLPLREAIIERLREVAALHAEAEHILQQSRYWLEGPVRPGTGATDSMTRAFALSAMSTLNATIQRLAEERRGLEMELLILALPALVSGPTLPAAPSGPPVSRNLILAGLLGIAVAVAAAFAVEYVRPSRVQVAVVPKVPPPVGRDIRPGNA